MTSDQQNFPFFFYGKTHAFIWSNNEINKYHFLFPSIFILKLGVLLLILDLDVRKLTISQVSSIENFPLIFLVISTGLRMKDNSSFRENPLLSAFVVGY